jgi:hypothetical protein
MVLSGLPPLLLLMTLLLSDFSLHFHLCLFSFVGVMLAFESFWRLLACFVMTIIQSS